MYKLIATIGAVAIAALLALGCGGGGEDEADASQLTKAEFVKQADAICGKFKKERKAAIVAWEKEFPGGEVPEKQIDVGLAQIVAPSMKQEAEALEALGAPEGDEQEVAQMIANLSKGSRVIAAEGRQGIPQSGLPQFEREATAYGLKACPSL